MTISGIQATRLGCQLMPERSSSKPVDNQAMPCTAKTAGGSAEYCGNLWHARYSVTGSTTHRSAALRAKGSLAMDSP